MKFTIEMRTKVYLLLPGPIIFVFILGCANCLWVFRVHRAVYK